ncbi:hypothetical protein [Acidipropionibacterium jensenii]|uniref:hypothetical protein n=1 Tax=Acidipropionibacterium jensenii TaxID=1749 RepID=UPI00214B0FBD|nr:hypothetical protein [Acidipropionibacterium jensenii]
MNQVSALTGLLPLSPLQSWALLGFLATVVLVIAWDRLGAQAHTEIEQRCDPHLEALRDMDLTRGSTRPGVVLTPSTHHTTDR